MTTTNVLPTQVPAAPVHVTFEGVESLNVSTAAGEDTISLLRAPKPDVADLAIRTGNSKDSVVISDHAANTAVSLGGSNDVAALQSTAPHLITINGETGADRIQLNEVGASTTTVFNGGADADTSVANGAKVPAFATTTIHGDAPATSPGDSLQFSAENVATTRTGTPNNGSIRGEGFGTINYTTLEEVVEIAAPIISAPSILPLCLSA